jgi:hypothetical protein
MGAVLFWLLATGVAFAAETTLTPVQQLQRGPVLAFDCLSCHASVADGKIPGITFSHGSHMPYACTACHPRFPHSKGKTEKPDMKVCWNCHALRHGPQGIIAKGDCAKCHTIERAKRRPKDHITSWAGTPHVAPGRAELSTKCMMCHTQAECDVCHDAKRVSWETTATFTYDPGVGCLACHAAELARLPSPLNVGELDASAHRDVTCPKCHPDFRYDDKPAATKLWNVNAGMSCSTSCHDHDKESAIWRVSTHGTKLLSGADLDAASCGGCHGGHAIERLKTEAAKLRLRQSGQRMCVDGCHTHDARYASYNDWWHGAAYKSGAGDAPACWSCHDAHDARAANDPKSSVHPEQLAKACGQDGCHVGATETFAAQGRALPHGEVKVKAENPLAVMRARILPGGR